MMSVNTGSTFSASVPVPRVVAEGVVPLCTLLSLVLFIAFWIGSPGLVNNPGVGASAGAALRCVYYRGSLFEDVGGIEGAMDSSKVIAQSRDSGQQLVFANLMNTTRGINGLIFDVAGLTAANLAPSDFVFRMSPTGVFNESTNPPSSWAPAPAPLAIVITPGTETTAARIRIDWAEQMIQNRWLQVKIKANVNTGLTEPQVFYIGHLVGETDGLVEGGAFRVRATDTSLLVERANPGIAVPVENVYDLNKDGRIRATDVAPAVASVGNSLTRITIPPSGSVEEG